MPVNPWRALFVVYAVVMTAGTHWPALSVGSSDQVAPDKLLHLLAFGALAGLMLAARWFARPWPVALVAVAWVVLDELSQAIPILQRTVSWQDVLAGLSGVALAFAWAWALRPVAAVRTRWLRMAVAGGLGAPAGGAAGWALASATAPQYATVAAIAGAAAGAAAAVLAATVRGGRGAGRAALAGVALLAAAAVAAVLVRVSWGPAPPLQFTLDAALAALALAGAMRVGDLEFVI